MSLRVRGTVDQVDYSEGKFDDGRAWTSVKLTVDGETVKIPAAFEVPAEGDVVDLVVAVGMSANPYDLLHPYRITLRATRVEVLHTAAEAEEARAARSAESIPNPRGKRAVEAVAAAG